MARDIKNKIAVITGGAEGIGFEIATKFLENGASHVILLDINEDLGKKALLKLSENFSDKVDFIKCDVTTDSEIIANNIFKKYKTVDVLVNNAGIVNEFDVKKTIGLNLISVIEWTFKFTEHMRNDKGGKGGTIINISSIYGYREDPYLPIYKASKHGVMGFTKTVGHEYHFKRTGVRVVAICPGYTVTNILDFKLPEAEVAEDLKKFLESPETVFQNADAVGKAAIDVFKIAESGTAWLIEGGNPIERVG